MKLPFNYTHKINPRSKSIKLKIDSNGQVVVTSPRFIPKFVINQFVKKNADWIMNALKKTKKSIKFNTNTNVYIFGEKYQKEIVFSKTKKTGIYILGKKIIFNPLTIPKITTQNDKEEWNEKFQKKIETFLKNTAGYYIIDRTHQLAKKMDLKFNKITLRKQKTRWGSCSSQKNLNFNWKLVHFDTDIIDYVIVHELSHLIEMNHSKKFWKLVSSYDPEYLKHRGWLKRNGLSLG